MRGARCTAGGTQRVKKMAAPGGGLEAAEDAEGLVLGRLEEEALKRRERLKALRQRTLQNQESGEPESKIPREDEEEEPVKHKEIKLRNYDPEDEELKKRKLPPAKPASGNRDGMRRNDQLGYWENSSCLAVVESLFLVGLKSLRMWHSEPRSWWD
ncbi:coiled-coil domain-containing protein 12 isoform X3 [Aphelocoma coerulescens]|uniref:coiled-coil domain-containing protein 12 isoform X3 n=1 Tax=Aphelocoma coerulescens TaxID=39617 RepID=UPI003604FB21